MKRAILGFCITAPLVVCMLSGEALKARCENRSAGLAAANIFAGVDPQTELVTALRKLKSAYPYRQTVTTTSTENDQVASSETSVTEFASASRIRVKSTGQDGKRSEMIIIGNFSYLFFEGKWIKQEQSADEKAMMEGAQDKFIASMSDVKFAGLETVNGRKCRAYTYRWGLGDISVSGKFPEGIGKAWIGVADGLPYQMDQDLGINGHRTKYHTVYEHRARISIAMPRT